MPKEYSRIDRVADFLKQELAQQIKFQVNDPRLGMININDVEVSRDLAHARVFFTVVGSSPDLPTNAAEGKKAAEVLNHAAGFLRKQLSAGNTMRTTPQLHFFYDKSVIAGGQLSALIDKAVASDKSHHHDDDQ
jgi:ribosome-binding factor A